jgi:hypothetical protein
MGALQNPIIINQVEKRKLIMPMVKGQKYAYTKEGMAKAKAAAKKAGTTMKVKPKAKAKAKPKAKK